MLRLLLCFLITPVAVTLCASAAQAQSRQFMLNECSSVAQTYFRDWTAGTEMKYNGQRVDGTHAINGRIYLETRFEDFACSYARNGRRMVEFFAEGRLQNAYLPGGGGDPTGSNNVRVTGVPANDVLNVRNGPGTRYDVVGALGNGDRVRQLVCQDQGNSRWCQIEMMTDMRERGWVNARYLSPGGTAQQTHPPAATARGTRSVQVRFPSGSSGTELRDELAPGASIRYVLNARSGQDLTVRISGAGFSYQIFNPDRTFLLDQVPVTQQYRGQLWQSGDHVIEIINRTSQSRIFDAKIGIR